MSVIAGLVNVLPGIVNTVGNLIKDKKRATAETSKILPAFMEDKHNIADGLELSSKVVFGYGLGGYVIYYALTHDPLNLWVLGAGTLIAVGTTIAKALER
ncbi:hypothetical protein LCGC14_0388840 [marine sediment metagenome]|uniref:Uncharacterized protein n=1 Tax=marine sediment metagenome TaxID=412755 RepID=A0A0F9TIF5_9ZZZZ